MLPHRQAAANRRALVCRLSGLAAACLLWLGVLSAPLAAQEPAPAPAAGMVLVDETTPPCPVVVVAKPSRPLLYGARALVDYLSRISGKKFSLVQQDAAPEGRAILLGQLAGDFAGGLPGDAYAYRVENGRLLIAGPTEKGTLNGIFAFLEEQLGCRWWSNNDEDVPTKPEIRLGELNIERRPVFLNMDIMNHEASRAVNNFPAKLRTDTSLQFHGGHSLYPLLTEAAEKNNEFWPYDKKANKRAPNKLHMCYSAPGIAEALAEALEKEIKKKQGNLKDFIYMVGMGDWYGGLCQCERCEAIHLEEGYTDKDGNRKGIGQGANLRMINAAAEILEKKYPGVKVGTFAYMTIERPPNLTKPRDNVYIWLPHLRHCIIHGVDKCDKNKGFMSNLKKWCDIAPGRVLIWDYAVNYGENFLFPFPVVHSMADNIKLYARLGVVGVRLQGNYVSTGGDLAVLKNWVWARLLWNPELDTNQLIEEFCRGYYGPAAEPLLAYVTELENAVLATAKDGPHMDEFAKMSNMRKTYLTEERVPVLRQHMAKARELANGQEPWARRVEEAAVSLDAMDLCRGESPFEEIDNKLVRTDMKGKYSYDRALRMTSNSREASFREWGPFRNYHSSFLASHGGPLVNLENGPVQVRIAPVQTLRYWQISYNGKPLLVTPRMVKVEKKEVLTGGGYDRISPSWQIGEVVGEPTPTRVEIASGSRSGNLLNHSNIKVVELLDGSVMRTTISGRRQSSARDNLEARNTIYMEWLAGPGLDLAGVEFMNAEGAWQKLEFTVPPEPAAPAAEPDKKKARGKKAEPEPETPAVAKLPEGVKALRVRLPNQGCMAEQHIIRPAGNGGKVEYFAKSGSLNTELGTVKSKVGDATRKTTTPHEVFCEWELRVLPLN